MTSILVTGDYVLDHHIYEGKRSQFADIHHRGVREKTELGGAALIHYLLANLGGGVSTQLSVGTQGDRMPELPDVLPSAYAVWKPFDIDKFSGKQVWRTDAAMGFGGDCSLEAENSPHWNARNDVPLDSEVLVLSDGGMGFRDTELQWPSKAAFDRATWIVLKTASPLASGSLWEHLTDKYSKKLVVVAASGALRHSQARISTGFSWDATVESIFEAIAPDGELAELRQCRHLILAFGTEGGLWFDLKNASPETKAHLVYDSEAIEGEHLPSGCGTAFGALSCLAAAVAWRLALNVEAPDLETALEGGLSALHDLLKLGHGPADNGGAGFPADRLAKQIKTASTGFARTVLAAPKGHLPSRRRKVPATAQDHWSIMNAAIGQQSGSNSEAAWEMAERVALYGPIALDSLPHLKIGNLMSADRGEIESLRVLRRLINEYKTRTDSKKPLSLGVFGPPGAGKSFAVKELASNLLDKEKWKDIWIEFNLSQFKVGGDDLIGAFHQIRDRVLKNQLCVAFFDEFDSRNYVWLQYLLAPMQDGAFQEGQITHPIGKCILIFAGGTSHTFDSFGPPEADVDAFTDFKMAKGPDFKSRLDGFLDVLGPNQRHIVSLSADKKTWNDKAADPYDIFYPIRRAFMIRSEFGCKPEQKLDIDPGLLHALLHVEKYTHGARSLSKVIEPLKSGHHPNIIRSRIAPRQQLSLYVDDAKKFLSLCREGNVTPAQFPEWPDATREPVAAAIHETWRRLGKDQGGLDKKIDVEFSQLPDFTRASNVAAADRMAKTLALIGLTITSGENTASEQEQVRLDIEHNLELLAMAEHEGWMKWHLDQGWEYDPVTQKDKKKHMCLLPYRSLSSADRNKDRDSVRHYPDYAKQAGMKIVKL